MGIGYIPDTRESDHGKGVIGSYQQGMPTGRAGSREPNAGIRIRVSIIIVARLEGFDPVPA